MNKDVNLKPEIESTNEVEKLKKELAEVEASYKHAVEENKKIVESYNNLVVRHTRLSKLFNVVIETYLSAEN